MYLFGAIYEFDEETHTSKITLEEVAYWRKQNAIHNWMVENVQRGVDNCASYDFDKSCLKSLLAYQPKKVSFLEELIYLKIMNLNIT